MSGRLAYRELFGRDVLINRVSVVVVFDHALAGYRGGFYYPLVVKDPRKSTRSPSPAAVAVPIVFIWCPRSV